MTIVGIVSDDRVQKLYIGIGGEQMDANGPAGITRADDHWVPRNLHRSKTKEDTHKNSC